MVDSYILKPKRKIMKLDNTDLNILGLLRQNARFTAKEIARKLRISREVVQYKIKNFEGKGLIKGWTLTLDHKLLNQQVYGVYTYLNYSCQEFILEDLKKIKNIIYIDIWNFNSVVLSTIVAKNLEEFEKLLSRIKQIFRKNIKNISISIVSKEFRCGKGPLSKINITKNYSRTSFQKEFLSKKEPFSIEMMKSIHHKILNILIKNCREPIISIAKKANVSINTVIKRVKELIKWGIIQHFTPVPDYSVLGFKGAFIYIKTRPCSLEEEKEIEEYFKESDLINWVIKYIGNYAYELEIYYKDYDVILEFIEELKKKFWKRIEALEFILRDKMYLARDYDPS